MPKRPDAHKIGDIALHQVAGIFKGLGWAVEPIKQDYGEDLLVQPGFRENIEHFRLWVQVKGTQASRHGSKAQRGIAIRVPAGTALRWARSADPVLVILWDVRRSVGVAGWAAASVADWKLFTRPVSIILSESFDAAAAVRFSRQAFLRHYDRLFVEALADGDVARMHAPDLAPRAKSRGEKFAEEVLAELGILRGPDNSMLATEFIGIVTDEQERSKRRNADRKRADALLMAFIRWVNDQWRTPLPHNVLSCCAHRLEVALLIEELVRDGRIRRDRRGRLSVLRAKNTRRRRLSG